MNEISQVEPPDAAQVSQPTPPPREQPIGFSPQFGAIVAALAKAHAAMTSPRRNKLVKVHAKSGTAYDFRYSTLDVINEMVREPLADNQLVPVHVTRYIGGREFVVTTILHPSEQWAETRSELFPEKGSNAQSRVAAISYAKRVNIGCLLDIASSDDEDGNAAAGNHVHTHNPREQPPKIARSPEEKLAQVEEMRVLQKFDRLINSCRLVLGAEDGEISHQSGVTVLQAWQAGLDAFQVFPSLPHRAEMWEKIQQFVPQALQRVWGFEIKNVWLGYLQATTPEQLERARHASAATAAEDIRKLKVSCPTGYALLMEHLAAQKARVGEARAEAEADPEMPEDPPPAEPEQYAGFETASVPTKTEVETAVGFPAQTAPDFVIFDEFGNSTFVVSDPVIFARNYATTWLSISDPEKRLAFEEHNADSIALAAEKDRRAGEILADLQSPGRAAADLFVVPPLNGAGQPILVLYYSAIEKSLESVRLNELSAWEEANKPTYDTLPNSPRLKVMQLIARRRDALGVMDHSS